MKGAGRRVLVTGGTGYIGGRLIPRLVEKGYRVRVVVRDPAKIERRSWAADVETRTGDLLEPSSLADAMEGMDAAYYLVHSMTSGHSYADREQRAAVNFVRAGKGLRRVIYLGGLLPDGPKTPEHLRSRRDVGRILREGLPTLEIRAGPIVGSGSASFEMVRYLTERLPILIGPNWIENKVQPIAVRDTLDYLVHSLDRDMTGVLDIGGEPLSFRQMLEVYAEIRGLKRRVVLTRPFLPVRFVAIWVALLTRIPWSLVAALLEGKSHPVLADSERAARLFPEITPMSYRVAVERALERMRTSLMEPWRGPLDRPYRMTDREGSNRETRSVWIRASPQRVFEEFDRLGGERGWLTTNWAWKVWGRVDRLLGGPGLRRSKRDDARLAPGEELGLWKVEASENPSLLRLRAEMRMPGEAWLQFETLPEDGGTRLIQRLLFEPIGLGGVAYWYAFYPMRLFLLSNLARVLANGAQSEEYE